jgi:hypothetical protein
MDTKEYFRSLTLECDALKNRVRNFIDNAHWLTDGEWKETVLRSIINRTISNTVSVGRGFIVKKNSCSTQIDVLIYDNTRPVLYRDGDLIFIPPISCKGIIEVKSNIKKHSLKKILDTLSKNAEMVLKTEPNLDLFVGLFSYDSNYNENNSDNILKALQKSANGSSEKIVNHLCLGKSIFAKYWDTNPVTSEEGYNSWHSYILRNNAIGYFLHNLMSHIANKNLIGNENVWFPEGGKEGDGKENKMLGFIQLAENA